MYIYIWFYRGVSTISFFHRKKSGGGAAARVEDIVDRYFVEVDTHSPLELLTSNSSREMCRRLVLFDDDDAMGKIVETHRRRAHQMLCEKMPADDAIADELLNFKAEMGAEVFKSILKELDGRSGRWAKLPENEDADDDAPSKRSTTVRRSVAAAATNSRRIHVISDDDDDDDQQNDESLVAQKAVPATRGGRGRGRGSRGGGAVNSSTRAKPVAAAKKTVVKTIFFTFMN